MNDKNYHVEPIIRKDEAESLLRKKQIINEVRLVYLPYRLSVYQVEMKRLFLKPRKIMVPILFNGINGDCNPVHFDLNEMVSGSPEGKCISVQTNMNECEKKSKDAVLFHVLKRFCIMTEPKLICRDVYDVYYPFWEYEPHKYVNSRRLVLEEV